MATKLMGLDREDYDREASAHSKSNITIWLLAGGVFNLINGQLISLPTLLLMFPGVFVISYLSIGTFYLERKKHQILPSTRSIVWMLVFTLTTIFDYIFPALAAIVTMKLLGV